MTTPETKLTRAQMQTEALIIQTLLGSVMALYSGTKPQDAIELVEMAQDRAMLLNNALDSQNAPELGA